MDTLTARMAQKPTRKNSDILDPMDMRTHTGYMPIEQYGLIGNLRTTALVAVDGGLDFMCWPNFDSPSVFCRLLDKDKGGYFIISPAPHQGNVVTKQQYLPSSNILQTMHLHDDGVMKLIDFFPRPKQGMPVDIMGEQKVGGEKSTDPAKALKKWLVRRVECVRGEICFVVRVLPAFNYARDMHTAEITVNEEGNDVVTFRSEGLTLELQVVVDGDSGGKPTINFKVVPGHELGNAVEARVRLQEGQRCSFVLREPISPPEVRERLTTPLVDKIQERTKEFWFRWISQSRYKGRWHEVVKRSLLTLKMLTFEPTGAIIAAPTFSLPESVGGTRNWDYRFSCVRDSSSTIYIFLRLGFKQEAEAFMSFIMERVKKNKTPDGALPIMFSIHGETDLPEVELDHLEGYRGSRPVRIGNGAATHKQLDIYGELLDAIYLYNKYGKPISYDAWLEVRKLADYVCEVWQEKDMSIWEVRGEVQNFVYSKIMLWVALDRALRLADKRSLPCPSRMKWLAIRDQIMEDVMERGYNKDMKTFIQSYEHPGALDAAVLIAPLVFFIAPNDPRFTGTLDRILRPPERGGLTVNGMVYRYNTRTSNDGIVGDEGAFSMVTFWLVEALTRASAHRPAYLEQAIALFENTLDFANHLSMFSEEIRNSGAQLGNTPQAFSHLALVSAAFNLDRAMNEGGH